MSTLEGLFSFNRTYTKVTFSKAFVYFFFLFFNFMVTFRVLLVTLLNAVEILLEYVYIASIFIYLGYRISKRIFEKNYVINALEGIMIAFFILPFIAGVASYMEFGQPLIYGVGTFRDFYLIYGALIVYNMLREGDIDIKLVERALLSVAWFNLFAFYAMSLFTNPADYQDTGAAGANELKGGEVYYRFNMCFMFFGTIYYSVKAFIRNKAYYLLYASLFLIYIVFFRLDRTSIAVTLGAVGAFLLFSSPLRRLVLYIFKFGIPLVFFALLSYFFFPEVYDQYILMFADVFDTVAATQEAGSSTESIRLVELEIALRGIAENPWFGNGKVSGQWVEGGYNYFYGFFYASDIGIFGQVFIYGIFGTLILYSQFPFTLYYSLRIRALNNDVFLLTLQYLMLALFVDSISNGYLSIYAAQSFTCMVLVYYYFERDKILRVTKRLKVKTS